MALNHQEPWDVIESYFQGNHLEQMVRHQIESYNDFVEQQIPKTINMFNNIFSLLSICSTNNTNWFI